MTQSQQDHLEQMQSIAASNAIVDVTQTISLTHVAIGKVLTAYAAKLEELIGRCDTMADVRELLGSAGRDDADWWKQ